MEPETAPNPEGEAPVRIRDEDGDLERDFIARVENAIAAEDAETARALVGDLHEADLGAVLEALDPEERDGLIRLLGPDFDWTALTEIDETVRNEILESIPNETISEGVRALDSDDAIGILESLDEEDRDAILAGLPLAERIALQRSLDYPEESAGRRMTTKFIAVPPYWTVGQTIDFMREEPRLPDEFTELYVVDPRFCFLGTVPLDRLLRAKRPTRVEDIMGEVAHSVNVEDDQEDVARLFERYNLLSVGVVDDSNRLVGVITVDDIVDVIEEEADEDIKRLAGVGDEELSEGVLQIVRLRSSWLLVNLVTAFLSASVIALFESTIERIAILAMLFPVVAGLGGNAGTQTLTVTVRALATRQLNPGNAWKLIGREALVGICNGLVLGSVTGLAVGLIFARPELGLVIAGGMLANQTVAALVGILIPLTLDKLDIDPAVASSIFVTAATDATGFAAFLGLATLLLV
ncbi:magnesium transporter [Propylenella binzhouense]|uniref:Magnesium transporter MgtE n=1 Tax=Propylenella binzhouense TaxID=2555902 RepID=A0A964WW26_9HYPH|nr:magnesium transporter [Propylenella binzhouense]